MSHSNPKWCFHQTPSWGFKLMDHFNWFIEGEKKSLSVSLPTLLAQRLSEKKNVLTFDKIHTGIYEVLAGICKRHWLPVENRVLKQNLNQFFSDQLLQRLHKWLQIESRSTQMGSVMVKSRYTHAPPHPYCTGGLADTDADLRKFPARSINAY